jgi:hypothetical protein
MSLIYEVTEATSQTRPREFCLTERLSHLRRDASSYRVFDLICSLMIKGWQMARVYSIHLGGLVAIASPIFSS